MLACAVALPAAIVASDSPAQDTRRAVCQALQVSEQTCAGQIDILAPLPMANGGLRVLSRRRVATGEQIALRADLPGSVPFLVLLHGAPGMRTPKTSRSATVAKTAFDVRAGTFAELVQRGAGVTLRRRVECLERGRAGDWIRVRDAGSGAVLRVQVVSHQELVANY